MAKNDEQALPPIEFVPAGANEEEQQENLEIVMPSPGFPTTAEIIAEIIEKRSETTVLDFSQQAVSMRFNIDSQWHTMPPMDRQTGDYMIATLKHLAGMDYRERRTRQEGKFRADYMRKKFKISVISQGTATGERIALYTEFPDKPKTDTLEECGMRPKMIEQVKGFLSASDQGLVLVTAMPGEGYTTAWRSTLSAADRFMRDYYVIEERSKVEQEVINVSSITYDAKKGEHPFTPVPQLLLREPHVIAFAECKSGVVLNKMCDLSIEQNMPIVTRVPGKHATDGLLRLMLLKPDIGKVTKLLRAVVAMRLIRKLCERCKVGFPPNPVLLQKLGIPPGRVSQLYQPFAYQPGMVDESGQEIPMCPDCQGLGFMYQTGIFELLVINDAIRDALKQSPNINQLMAIAKSQNHISIRDEGIVLVARGVTSIEELQRVLRK